MSTAIVIEEPVYVSVTSHGSNIYHTTPWPKKATKARSMIPAAEYALTPLGFTRCSDCDWGGR